MSARGPATTDARLGVAVRPFRLAVFALAEPLALLETMLDVADALPTALQPRFGMLDVDSFGVLASEAAPGTDVADPRSGRGRGRRDAETTQTAPSPSSGDGGPKAHARASRLEVEEETPAEPAGDTGGEATNPAGTEAGSAIVAKGSLLERLADAALEAVGPSSSRSGGSRRSLPADAASGDRRRDPARGLQSPKSRGAGTGAPGSAGSRIASESPAFGPPTEAARGVAQATAAGRLVPHVGVPTAASELAGRSPSPAGAAPLRNRELTPRPNDAFAVNAVGIADPILQTGGGAPAHGVAGAGLLEQLADSALSASEPARAELAAPSAPADATRRLRALDQLFPGAHSPARSSEPDSPAPALSSGPDTPTRPAHPAEAGAVAAPPQELAWLVNEALVEQARRHGVDLS